MNRLIWIAVAFQAVTLGQCMVIPGFVPISGFISSCLVFAFLCYLDRKRSDREEEFHERLTDLQNRMSNIQISVGMM